MGHVQARMSGVYPEAYFRQALINSKSAPQMSLRDAHGFIGNTACFALFQAGRRSLLSVPIARN